MANTVCKFCFYCAAYKDKDTMTQSWTHYPHKAYYCDYRCATRWLEELGRFTTKSEWSMSFSDPKAAVR